ncbi:DUF3039 domain-containing protein [Microbacterium sp. H37-C3]|uniref:DUF3039 domain-containing protein n=1 Tax=Microbacterium sp. H37-C3 TaxID=3004354 RepID=UPI0022B0171A|nr:DUF3039 domain-containing protein [Microbacterium sp. H37-C3]MCZ4066463.1 DUF3039 domain-containing protein [Microbacterium sp. H37-C3]
MTLTDDRVDEKTTTAHDEPGDHDLFSHYARKTDIERSMFEGVDITALCGKQWRPSRDFTKFPVCPTCKDIYEGMQD